MLWVARCLIGEIAVNAPADVRKSGGRLAPGGRKGTLARTVLGDALLPRELREAPPDVLPR